MKKYDGDKQGGSGSDMLQSLLEKLDLLISTLNQWLCKHRSQGEGSDIRDDNGRAQSVMLGPKVSADTAVLGKAHSGLPVRPYVDVARGLLPDGQRGSGSSSRVFKGVSKPVIAQVLQENWIDVMGVTACRTRDGLATVDVCKSRAWPAIAKVKKALAQFGIAIRKAKNDCHSLAWNVDRSKCLVTFSVDLAVERAQVALKALNEGNMDEAYQEACEAVKIDKLVQLGHEIVCRSAVQLDPSEINDTSALEKSLLFLRRRVEQLQRCINIMEQSLPKVEGDERWDRLPETLKRYRDERDELKALITKADELFGHLLGRRTRADERANKAILLVRDLKLSADAAVRDPRSRPILEHRRVNWLRDEAERRLPKNACATERRRARAAASAVVFELVVDPAITPEIRLICASAKFKIWETLDPRGNHDKAKADELRLLDQVESKLLQENEGRRPTVEELSAKLGWTVEKVERIQSWRVINRPGGLDELSQEQRMRRRKPSDDPEDDTCDSPEGGAEGDDEGSPDSCD